MTQNKTTDGEIVKVYGTLVMPSTGERAQEVLVEKNGERRREIREARGMNEEKRYVRAFREVGVDE